MRTEEDIIYTIWDIVRGAQANQDDPINERLMRAFLRIHRGKLLTKAYNNGMDLPDEVFQYMLKTFTKKNDVLVSSVMPKIIRFKDNYGFQVEIEGYPVSVVESGAWRNAKKDRFNKYHPLIKFVNNKMILSLGKEQPNQLDDVTNSGLNTLVRALAAVENNTEYLVNMQAVLVDPDDGDGYNFTTSPYPLPDELIEDLINSVNAREFNMFLRVKSDETADLRNNAQAEDTSQEY